MSNPRNRRCNGTFGATVTIPLNQYADLIASATMLDMIESVYQSAAEYNLHEALAPFFAPAPGKHAEGTKEDKHE